ncbi:MAG: 4'-phosphopantetheinyl transferase family protein [Methyloligellaceae bacterium]
MIKAIAHRFFNEWLHPEGNALPSREPGAAFRVNLLGGDRSLNAGIAIYRLQISSENSNDLITVVCARDSELSRDEYLDELDEYDLAEIALCKSDAAYQKQVASRVLRRKALTIATDGEVAVNQWKFGRTKEGKPYICEGFPEISFSITHCDGATFAAVSTQYNIGIDAELAEGIVEDALINDVLSIGEYQSLRGLPEDKRNSRFFELWTLKEAYTKLTGTGLAVDLKQIAFELNSQCVDAIGHNLQARFLTWKTFNGSSSCQIALALR